MSEWWTYSLSDFLLFSPRTYYRLFELYNLAVWPWHVLAIVLGLAVLVLWLRRGAWQGRTVAVLLAACWLFVAWGSEEHTSELQSRGLISYAVFCLKKKK